MKVYEDNDLDEEDAAGCVYGFLFILFCIVVTGLVLLFKAIFF